MMIGAWGRLRRDSELSGYLDVESGAEIEPIEIDAATGAKLGSRAIRMSSF